MTGIGNRHPARRLAKHLAITKSVEPGRVVFRGTPEFNVTNPMGTVRGWYGTLMDSAMACSVMTRVPKVPSTQRLSSRSISRSVAG